MGPADFCGVLGFHKQIAIYFNEKQQQGRSWPAGVPRRVALRESYDFIRNPMESYEKLAKAVGILRHLVPNTWGSMGKQGVPSQNH